MKLNESFCLDTKVTISYVLYVSFKKVYFFLKLLLNL